MTTTLSQNLYKAARKAYAPASRACQARKTLPILSHYHLYTRDGYMHLDAVDTSGDVWELLAGKSPARVETEIDTCVPMRPFRDWLGVTAKYKTALTFSLDARTQNLTITEKQTAGSADVIAPSRVTFKCIDPQEFPAALPYKVQ